MSNAKWGQGRDRASIKFICIEKNWHQKVDLCSWGLWGGEAELLNQGTGREAAGVQKQFH